MQIENKDTRTKNKNTICAKQTWKCIFTMLTYANINMKRKENDKVMVQDCA
jgi:hypothetical protein